LRLPKEITMKTIGMTGKHHTEETKKKISLKNSGKGNGRYGVAWSNSQRKGISYRTRDEKNPAWKGGTDKWFKKRVLKRDNHTCQICGLKDDEIMVMDHIKPKSIYPELRHEITNLQTLCPNCHARKTNAEKKEIIRIKKARIII